MLDSHTLANEVIKRLSLEGGYEDISGKVGEAIVAALNDPDNMFERAVIQASIELRKAQTAAAAAKTAEQRWPLGAAEAYARFTFEDAVDALIAAREGK